MDGGLSWADQWDYNPDPSPMPKDEDDKKGKDGKNKSGMKKLSFKWFKSFGKKSNKDSNP